MNNVTNKTVVAFKNHQTNKSEFGLMQNVDSINIVEVFCKWVETQHNGIKRMFDFKGVDVWILNVVCDAFPKFENSFLFSKRIFKRNFKCSIFYGYDEVMVAGLSRVGLMVSKRNVNKDDAIICSSDVTGYEIILTLQSTMNGEIKEFSMLFVSADDVKLLD